MMRNEEKEVERYIREHGMISEGDVVAAGVSGGADSVCLLFVLFDLREKLGFSLKVCHVNHGLRGAEADADEMYVRRLCRELDIPCRVFYKNVELIAKKWKQSHEEAGRTARQEAFETMCTEEGCTKIATAHHREDNAETVLLNMARGTGLKGLCGIRPNYGKIIRPLLVLTRGRIEEYLNKRGICWCEDMTNAEDDYTRNRIRHHILPLLETQVNKGAARHIDELTRQAQEVWELLDHETKRAWQTCVTESVQESAGGVKLILHETALTTEMPAVRKELVKRCLSYVMKSTKNIGTVHILSVLGLFERQSGRCVDLPGGIRAQRVYEGVMLGGKEKETTQEEIVLQVPGITEIPDTDTVITCRFLMGGTVSQARELPQKGYTKWIDYDIMKCRLSVRTRRSGDTLAVAGAGGRQKLKEYFINEKIPRDERDKMLLIADGDRIVWIPGKRLSEDFKIGSNTKRILEIKITEERKNG